MFVFYKISFRKILQNIPSGVGLVWLLKQRSNFSFDFETRGVEYASVNSDSDIQIWLNGRGLVGGSETGDNLGEWIEWKELWKGLVWSNLVEC